MNSVILTGRIAHDLVRRQTASGKTCCSFSIAVKIPGGEDKADFFDISTWEQQAEFVLNYLGKGRKIIVEGYLHTRTYDDKDGNKRKVTEVVAKHIEPADSKPQGPFAEPPQQYGAPQQQQQPPQQQYNGQYYDGPQGGGYQQQGGYGTGAPTNYPPYPDSGGYYQ